MTSRLVMMLCLTTVLTTGCLKPRSFVYDRERVSEYLHRNPDVPGHVVNALMDGNVIKGMTQREVVLCLGKPTKKESNTLYGATTEKWFYSRPVQQSGGLERSQMWHKEIPLARVLFGQDGRVTHCQVFGRPSPPPPPASDASSTELPDSRKRRMSDMMPPHLERRTPPPTWTAVDGPGNSTQSPDAPAGPKPATGAFDSWPAIALTGISSGGSNPTAIINRQVVSAGETVAGVNVLEITPDGVLLQYKDDLQFLPMQR